MLFTTAGLAYEAGRSRETVILDSRALVIRLSLLNFFSAKPWFAFGAIFYLQIPIISYRLAQHTTYDTAAVKKVGTCDFSLRFSYLSALAIRFGFPGADSR